MDNVLRVQVNKALERHVQTELAEAFRVLTLQVLKHGGEGTTVHELHEDPKAVLVVESLEALNDRLTLRHLHDTDFVFNCLTLCLVLGLSELQCEELTVRNALASKNSSKSANALLAHDLVVLRRVLLLDVGRVLDTASNFATVLECLLRRVKLTKDDLEKCARVRANLFLAKYTHLNFERLWEVYPLPDTSSVLLDRALNTMFSLFFVLEHEVVRIYTVDNEVTELFKIAIKVRVNGHFHWFICVLFLRLIIDLFIRRTWARIVNKRIFGVFSVDSTGRSLLIYEVIYPMLKLFLKQPLLFLLRRSFVLTFNNRPDGVPSDDLRAVRVKRYVSNLLHALTLNVLELFVGARAEVHCITIKIHCR